MADLQPLLPRKIPQSVFPPIAPDLSSVPQMPNSPAGGALGMIASPSLPNVINNPRMVANSSDPLINRASADAADLYKRSNPIAPTTTLGKIGHVAAGIGNVLGNIFAPTEMALIHGTQLNNEIEKNRDRADINTVSELQNQEAQRKQTEAQTGLTNAETQLLPAKTLATLNRGLITKGYKPATFDQDGNLQIEEDPDSQAYRDRVALSNLRNMQAQRAQVLSQAGQPGSPLYEQKQHELAQIDQRIAAEQQALGLRGAELGLHRESLSFNEDKNYNPEPTAQERKTGDLAQSAVNQVQTMRQIVQAHPEVFGPLAGRTTTAQAWLGSQSPDAQKYLSASRYLADHSAGVFGSRSVEITKALEQLTDPKMNPEALNASLDTAESTAKHFVKAGTPHAKGEQGAAITSPNSQSNSTTPTLPKEIADQIPEGHQATLSDGSIWKKVGGKTEKVK